MQVPLRRVLGLATILMFGAIGCASTQVVNQWRNPEYVSPRYNRVLLIGISNQASIRRTFEDEFVARLKEAGVESVPSYRYIPEDGQVDEARLQQAVEDASADAVIITRLIGTERRTTVIPGSYYPFSYGFYPGYSAAWMGYYEPARITQYDVYISETSLYDTSKNELVWSGTVQTTAPGNISQEIKRYVDTVVKALGKERLLVSG